MSTRGGTADEEKPVSPSEVGLFLHAERGVFLSGADDGDRDIQDAGLFPCRSGRELAAIATYDTTHRRVARSVMI